jgi:phosphatidylglycerol:prolipoprotein diacylglycerol transferase
MHNELFSIGPFTVYTYGLMVAIGILAAFYVAEKRGKKLGLDVSKLDVICLWLLVGGFLCSKLLYWTTRLPDIIQDPSILLDLANGWVVYGGITGGLLAGWLYCRIHKMNFLKYFDLLIPEVALAQGFGRIGCFFAGCCYGMETDAWYGITFPMDSIAPGGVPLVPTQLMSAAFDFALFFILIWLSKKCKTPGALGGWYLILYSIGRFIIEFWRGDLIRGKAGLFSTSQYIAILMLAAGIFLVYFWPKIKAKKQANA